MEELATRARELAAAVDATVKRLGIAEMRRELADVDALIKRPDFWADNQAAQTTMKRRARLEDRIKPWQELQQSLQDIRELIELGDGGLESDLRRQLESAVRQFETLKRELRFSGAYDDHDAILSLHAGAGGTDAQDWAAMLMRMYVRWAEKNGFAVETIDQSAGEEAGIKSATLQVTGNFAYGKLKGEHGVHRLVRLSPFNADNLRQTSFAKVEVLPAIREPSELDVDEKDLKIDVFRAGGHGGQSVNTTDSAVRVTHVPTGITVSMQNERSQLQNKERALTILRSRLAQLQLEQHKDKISELKGPNQSAEWGNQIRSYVLHPYKQVKDLRTRYETSDPDAVLAGQLDPFIEAYLEQHLADGA